MYCLVIRLILEDKCMAFLAGDDYLFEGITGDTKLHTTVPL